MVVVVVVGTSSCYLSEKKKNRARSRLSCPFFAQHSIDLIQIKQAAPRSQAGSRHRVPTWTGGCCCAAGHIGRLLVLQTGDRGAAAAVTGAREPEGNRP